MSGQWDGIAIEDGWEVEAEPPPFIEGWEIKRRVRR